MARRTPELDRRGGDNPQGAYGLPYHYDAQGQIVRNDGRLWRDHEAEARYTMPLIFVLARESEDAAD